MRRPLIAGNWKMHKTGAEAMDTVTALANLTARIQDRDIMVAPPFTAIPLVAKTLKNTGSQIQVGAQNIHHEAEGAFTGEISASMLKDAGATHVIIGHSERRECFSESDEQICQKLKAAIEAQLIPIMCIGETENEKSAGKTFNVLDKQIRNGLKGFRSNELTHLVIAYEPVWAIGTGKTATADEVDTTHQFIRSVLNELFKEEFSLSIRILYGGSVKPTNILELMQFSNIDGVLVGGASLNAEIFSKIICY